MAYSGRMNPLAVAGLYVVTALAEIAGCYAIYAWLRLGKPVWWLVPGAMALFLFGYLLTLHPGPAGRIYAAYGAVYIASSIVWMWAVERHAPDRWDSIGVAVCLLGAAIIYFGPRG
jgi:small multidrug resistance family-3 protein